ncbi:MAG: TetR/AcrR family transcriptional regulator [Victivallaceae bacterium]|nr:TetR/AcrR family transcriptional regulator [Victivallaceae bacterium]
MRAEKTDTETRRGQITEAAIALISDGGINNLNIAGIAEKIGIVPSAVYRHFKNKEEILGATLLLVREQLLNNVAKVEAEADGALARLRLLLELHANLLKRNPVFPHIVFAHFSQSDDTKRWSNLDSTINAYLQGIARVVKQGQQMGEIRSEIPAHNIAMMFIGLVLPIAMLHRPSDEKLDILQHLDVAWQVFVRGLEPNNIKIKIKD